MADANRTTLIRQPKAFQIDVSWYQSYWYERPLPEVRSHSFRSAQVFVWAALFVAGAYFAF